MAREYRKMPTRFEYERECKENEAKFGHREVTSLYPLIDVENGVRTRHGEGTLLSAYGNRGRVLLLRDSEEMARAYFLTNIKPAKDMMK